MAVYVKFNVFAQDKHDKVHDLFGTNDTLRVYLSNTAPNVATNAVKADLAEISTGNGYSGAIDVQNDGTRSGVTLTVTGISLAITASGGSIGPFRYIVLYNDTPSSPADPLIAYWDLGTPRTLASGETFEVKFSGASVGNPGTIFTDA